jgi:hypothetical protein
MLILSASTHAAPPTGFFTTQVHRPDGNQWEEAVALTFDPIGRLWVAERGGRIWIVDPDDPHAAAPLPFLDIREEVGSWQDHGMLGMELDPQFNQNGYAYIFYFVDRHPLLRCSEAPGGVGLPVCEGKDRNFYRVVEALGVENDRCILVLAPHEPVSRGYGIVAA